MFSLQGEDSDSFEDEEEFEVGGREDKVAPGKLDTIELSEVSTVPVAFYDPHCSIVNDFLSRYFQFQSAVRRGPVWRTYVIEMVMVTGMVLYLVGYFVGRGKNSAMAHSW